MKSILPLELAAALAILATPAAAKPYTRNVAIVVYDHAEPLDWTGPFEVYNDAARTGAANGEPAFNVYIVSKTKDPVNAQGMWVTPSYSIADAPKPDIVLFPGGPSNNIYDDPEFFAWATKVSKEAEIAQSVCTGAFVLGKAGMLDGLEVTTFHGAIDALQKMTPKTAVKRGRRFVDNGHIVTTAGISAGIDGSLHVVARLLGRRVADQVATYMEYAWVPEASLATTYSYFNPSTDELGRLTQNGDLAYDEKRYGEAEKTFRTVVERTPKSHDAWSNLGEALSKEERHADAAEAFAHSIDVGDHGPSLGYAYYRAALENVQAGRKDQAIALLGKAFENGFTNRSAVSGDERFASIVGESRVQQMLAAR
jgi:putative intracellular protease/amidase